MKLYLTAAGYHGTQAEAKSFSKDYEQVEVPTDKPGLIEYLNRLHNERSDREDQFTTVVERQDPPIDSEPHDDLDQLFEKAPISHRLRLAVGAIDAADAALRSPITTQRQTGMLKANAEIAGDADELFS